ncbi:alpha-1,6-mannosyltransferase [Madurella fahalii]|uniref:Alpha-1,6-mannosyltransferase n=1 Tax=Madurella fahalii TaxID=1157608 RepID=A0ABQ0GGN9_9PEZI
MAPTWPPAGSTQYLCLPLLNQPLLDNQQCHLWGAATPVDFPSSSMGYQVSGVVEVADCGPQQSKDKTDMVCFGMITGIVGSCPSRVSTGSRYSVQLESANSFAAVDDATLTGRISSDFTFLVTNLLDEKELELEVSLSVTEDSMKPAGKPRPQRVVTASRPCSLDIVLYGPMSLFEDIGSYLQDYDIYLQDPVDCKRHVLYCNPHRLPPLDPTAKAFTSDLATLGMHRQEMDDVGARPDLLDILNSQEDLLEARQPPSVKTVLAKHQKQALTFMLDRECGWAWDGSRPDIWEAQEIGQHQYFINRISDTIQENPPPQFYGGIIADPMGLGKTLAMIALVASDIRTDDDNPPSLPLSCAKEPSSGRTLVVVPPALLGTWEEQLKEHLFPNSLTWSRHHGRSRLLDPSHLQDTRIVLTTYHTVSMEWRHGAGAEISLLFKTRWKRVILDEAHYIRNSESQMARAICSLDSVARWAVTGTPIQNRLADLATLLKFLGVYPYSEKRAFDTDIANLWKSGKDEDAVRRLKRLSGCLLLRRPKETVQLPARRDLQCLVEFTPAERASYEDIRTQALEKIDEALLQAGDCIKPHSFVNVLQRIEAMRMICNLGLHYHSRHSTESMRKIDSTPDSWSVIAQRALDLRRGMGQVQCCSCGSNLDDTDDEPSGPAEQSAHSLFSQCLQFICSVCAPRFSGPKGRAACACEDLCPVAPVSINPSAVDDPEDPTIPPAEAQAGGEFYRLGLSSKVATLVKDLRQQPPDVKCVIFSTWRTTLDLVEVGLKQALIPCLRFDGKVPQKDRQGVVERFRHDPSVKVLLLTLSCGAVGLTLTVASRAYLMEPHWNPTLEDQALARIHRMGQRREVTTVRFVITNSFEERVIEIQSTKRDLASILLNPHRQNGSSPSGKPLEVRDLTPTAVDIC